MTADRTPPNPSAALDDLFRENAIPMSDRNGRLYDIIEQALAAAGSTGQQPAGEPSWQRRQGYRRLNGERQWGAWHACTEAEASRVTGLHSWQVRQVRLVVATPTTQALPVAVPAYSLDVAARRAITTFAQVLIDCQSQARVVEWWGEMEMRLTELRSALAAEGSGR